MAADLGEVGRLELQGELHQRVGDICGGFIGDGVFWRLGCCACASSGSLRAYSSMSSFMRKLLPSMMTVSA